MVEQFSLSYLNGSAVETLSLPNYLGEGLFETMVARMSPDGRSVTELGGHLNRLLAGCGELGITPPDVAQVGTCLERVLHQPSENGDIVVRIIVERERWILKATSWYPSLPEAGIKACLYNGTRSLPMYKSFSSLTSVVARRSAESRGAHEAILVDDSGRVTEGAWSNIFVVTKTGELYTPDRGMLPGVTRGAVLKIHRVKEGEVTVSMLREATEVFITQATNGVVPVIELEGVPVGTGEVGRVTSAIRDAYRALPRETIAEVLAAL